jgi:hypothetical protein
MPASTISLPQELERFRAKLLDLGLRNPLLNYRVSKRRTIEVVEESPDEVYRRLVVQAKPMTLLHDPEEDETARSQKPTVMRGESQPLLDIADLSTRTIERGSRRRAENQLQTNRGSVAFQSVARLVSRDAKNSIEETGINYLHLAVGFLRWRENDSTDSELRMAPLMLIPITIASSISPTGGHTYQISWNEDEVLSNACLRKKLELDFAIALPEISDEQFPDDYFMSVSQAIQKKERWHVDRKMLLGFFSFHKLSMYMDIAPENWTGTPALDESSLANQLVSGGGSTDASLYAEDYEIDDHSVATKIALPLDADSSQHSAITDIAQGKSLVIEGPPGTGKSQTIANAIAHAVEQGKRVLFVAEKMAALEVVHKRLSQAGLADFCLELHGHAVAPKKVMESLASRLGMDRNQRPNQAGGANRLEECKAKLRAYLRASSKQVGPYREPLYSLFWRIVQLRQTGVAARRDIPCELETSLDSFQAACDALEAFSKQSEVYENPTKSAWWGYFPRDLAPTEADRILREIDRLRPLAESVANAHKQMKECFENAPDRIRNFLNIKASATLDELAKDAPASTPIPFSTLADDNVRNAIEQLELAYRCEMESHRSLSRSLVDDPSDLPKLLGSLSKSTIEQLRRFGPSTSTERLRELQVWGDQTQRLIDVHRQRMESWSRLGIPAVARIQDIESAIQMAHLFQHSAISDHGSIGVDWFLDSQKTVLGKIRTQQESLAKRREEISKLFHLASVPDRAILVEVIRQLRSTGGTWLSWLNRDYRKATKELKAFAKFPSGYSFAKRMAALESLESFDKDFQAFESDAATRRVIGCLFNGLETDWNRVKTLYDWVAVAKRMGLDHAKTNSLLQRRSELPLGTGIPNLKLEFQQLCGQLTSELGKAAGVDPVTVMSLRMQDVEAIVAAAATTSQQALEFVEQLKNRAGATVRDLLDVIETAAASNAAKVQADTILASGNATIRRASQLIRDQGESFAPVFAWLQRFQSQVRDPLLLRALDRSSAKELTQLLASLHGTVWNAVSEWNQVREKIVGTAECTEVWLAAMDRHGPKLDLAASIQSLHNEASRLPGWLAWCRTYARCRRAHVGPFALAAANEEIPESQLADCYRLSLFNQIAETELRNNEIGFHFTAKEIEDIRASFQRLDRSSMAEKSMEIRQTACQRPVPEGNGRGRVAEYTELALIRHEIGKKTRHCKIRDLMLRAGTAIQSLKPCFLMSPLSLARYIANTSMQFDLVIMDEASQIKPEDAMGAILRAQQLVVVGDPKQLPPTSFFDHSDDEVEDEEATQFDNAESILEVAQRSFQPYRRLRWHYRSQHESLIQFSNRSFYDEDLVVFPSPKGTMGGYGIKAHYVEGASCTKGENLKESEAVVARILEHARMHPDESLGVAAFNIKQAEMIDSLLRKACDQDNEMSAIIADMEGREDGLFIKNLESIQGDERDVMIISYTYGPDAASGRVFQRFGPINSEFGWRRLNVMVTRARKRMEIFSSMRPSDIQYGPDKSRGVNAYHDFLEFAFSGAMREVGSESGREPGSPFEESVARVVDSMGMEPVFQVGVAGFFIDIGVRRREGSREFVLGIECDGASYHSSRSARDRDRLREEIITSRGWKLHRIWSTEWFLNQKTEEERLARTLQKCLAEDAS